MNRRINKNTKRDVQRHLITEYEETRRTRLLSKKNRAIPLLQKQKIKSGIWFQECWKVNDNTIYDFSLKPLAMKLATLALMAFMLIGMNGSSIITNTVLHTDGKILKTMMDINPEAVGYMLNSMDIGE